MVSELASCQPVSMKNEDIVAAYLRAMSEKRAKKKIRERHIPLGTIEIRDPPIDHSEASDPEDDYKDRPPDPGKEEAKGVTTALNGASPFVAMDVKGDIGGPKTLDPMEERELIEKIISTKRKLALLSQPMNDHLHAWEEMESCLRMVDESASSLLHSTVILVATMLGKGYWLRHQDEKVKLMVTSCLIEILRISVPNPPYDRNTLKVIIEVLVDSFKTLGDFTSSQFHRRITILKVFAEIRITNLMLNLEVNELIYEMFDHFIVSVGVGHTNDIIAAIRDIMVLVIEEGDYVYEPLLSMLLAIQRKDLIVSPTAHDLVVSVIKRCEKKLKTFLDDENWEEQAIVEDSYEKACEERDMKEEIVDEVPLPNEVCLKEIQSISVDTSIPMLVENVIDIKHEVEYVEGFLVCDSFDGCGLDLQTKPLDRCDHISLGLPCLRHELKGDSSLHKTTLSSQSLVAWGPSISASRDDGGEFELAGLLCLYRIDCDQDSMKNDSPLSEIYNSSMFDKSLHSEFYFSDMFDKFLHSEIYDSSVFDKFLNSKIHNSSMINEFLPSEFRNNDIFGKILYSENYNSRDNNKLLHSENGNHGKIDWFLHSGNYNSSIDRELLHSEFGNKDIFDTFLHPEIYDNIFGNFLYPEVYNSSRGNKLLHSENCNNSIIDTIPYSENFDSDSSHGGSDCHSKQITYSQLMGKGKFNKGNMKVKRSKNDQEGEPSRAAVWICLATNILMFYDSGLIYYSPFLGHSKASTQLLGSLGVIFDGCIDHILDDDLISTWVFHISCHLALFPTDSFLRVLLTPQNHHKGLCGDKTSFKDVKERVALDFDYTFAAFFMGFEGAFEIMCSTQTAVNRTASMILVFSPIHQEHDSCGVKTTAENVHIQQGVFMEGIRNHTPFSKREGGLFFLTCLLVFCRDCSLEITDFLIDFSEEDSQLLAEPWMLAIGLAQPICMTTIRNSYMILLRALATWTTMRVRREEAPLELDWSFIRVLWTKIWDPGITVGLICIQNCSRTSNLEGGVL